MVLHASETEDRFFNGWSRPGWRIRCPRAYHANCLNTPLKREATLKLIRLQVPTTLFWYNIYPYMRELKHIITPILEDVLEMSPFIGINTQMFQFKRHKIRICSNFYLPHSCDTPVRVPQMASKYPYPKCNYRFRREMVFSLVRTIAYDRMCAPFLSISPPRDL